MRKSHKFVALRPEVPAMRRHPGASVAMLCHPEARFWPKDLSVARRLDFVVELLRAQNALGMTIGQRV